MTQSAQHLRPAESELRSTAQPIPIRGKSDPVFRLRAYRNTDPPALGDLWNHSLPEVGVVRPLTAHEFDALIIGKQGFEPGGLIVAEADGRVIGFTHAGFGPAEPLGPSQRLDFTMGTIAMLVIEPGRDNPHLETALVQAAEAYLRSRGAQVLYAGGMYPLNPFYWGLYGGSEFAGILSGHMGFQRAVMRSGYQPVSRTLLMEADLERVPTIDPRTIWLRRQVRVEIVEDALAPGWWDAQAIGLFRPTRFRLFGRNDGSEMAHALTWDIASNGTVGDGRPRTALIDVSVAPAWRRRGVGRLLLGEVFRHARSQYAEILSVQTPETNDAALGLYRATGFHPVEVATLYRLPGEIGTRSVPDEPSPSEADGTGADAT